MMVSANEFHAANKRALQRMAKAVRAVSAKYDRRIGMVVVQLSSGLYLQFRPRDIQGMEHARPSDLIEIVISPSGRACMCRRWMRMCMFRGFYEGCWDLALG